MRLSIIGFSYKMLSYSVINLKLLQNIVFKLSDKRNCLLFFLLVIKAEWEIQHDFCPEEAVSCRQCLSVCFLGGEGQGKELGFFHHVKYLLRGKLIFMSAAIRRTVRPVCYSWLKKQVTMLATCCSSVSPHMRKLPAILCSRAELLWASHLVKWGERSASCGEGMQKSAFFFGLICPCFSTGQTPTF